MAGKLHLVKLCVGVETVAELEGYIGARAGAGITHVTRMWPKREAELTDGGSLYWVIKGLIQARQRIVALEERVGDDGIRRCAIHLAPELVRTETVPRRAFQGWRYLQGADAPSDLAGGASDADEEVPADLRAALADIGVR